MDSVEARLLDTVIREPADAHAREVYADWLEQHGWETRATFLRLDAIGTTPPEELARVAGDTPFDRMFRADVSRTKVARCVTFAFACPKHWSDLRQVENYRFRRHCDHCQQTVTFVATAAEAQEAGAAGRCIAIDPAVARGDLERAFDRGTRAHALPMMMGVVAAPHPGPIRPPIPANPPPPPKPTVMKRIRGWFTK